jgi:predicted N-formylglutamate amidohydrolase
MTSNSLLTANEPGPFELVRPGGKSPFVLICDHASNRIPRSLNRLGLDADQLGSHIAWDPGAAALARKLSARLDATLLLSNYSRLVIDCNRSPGHPDSIITNSDRVEIPGNIGLSNSAIAQRRRTLFDPYHQAIASVLSRLDRNQARLLSIHSFTADLAGEHRPWSIGVCYDESREWARKILLRLRTRVLSETDQVGDNQPFSIEPGIDYTIPVLAKRFHISALMLELRQDKIADELMVQRWSNIIAGCCLN